ncbi:MAG: ImmA/IrrE family metallo-endopeptidase [Lachnospiraceae bacterium]|nr:ImmA/IrrE family metallo-endopeptidase [Lachnospiraceae bacterium]
MDSKKFIGDRLKSARQFRGYGITDLSKLVGISKQSLSLYENGDNIPPHENVLALAHVLGFPYEFFMREDNCKILTDNTYFRSQTSATKKDRLAQTVKLEYVAKMYEVLLEYVDFPSIDLPKIEFPSAEDSCEYDSDEVLQEIEVIADKLREDWKLGRGPIKNLQYILEEHGIIVTGFRSVNQKIDAFSQRVRVPGGEYMYIIALALGSKPTQRLRFDMAHELGHILLHPWGEETDDLSKDEFNGREKQANMFASALLLPRDSFGEDVAPYATDLEYYKYLKKKWNMSMQAMMYRARQLNIITANQFQYMMRRVSKNGWRTKEPGDVPGNMNDTIFQGAIDVLFEEGYLDAKAFIRALGRYGIIMRERDIEDLLCLKEGTLKIEDKVIPLIRLKQPLEE